MLDNLEIPNRVLIDNHITCELYNSHANISFLNDNGDIEDFLQISYNAAGVITDARWRTVLNGSSIGSGYRSLTNEDLNDLNSLMNRLNLKWDRTMYNKEYECDSL